MALLRVELDNVYAFNNFKATFSYPKKLVNSSLDGEFLKDYPNVRYKKLNILMGSNSTAKTTFGLAIWKIFMFFSNKESSNLTNIIADKSKKCSILMDLVFNNGYFYRVEIEALSNDINMRIRTIQLRKDDSYEDLIKRLDESVPFNNYLQVLEGFDFSGWNFAFPSIEKGFDKILCDVEKEQQDEYADLLYKVLSSFDPSIKTVVPSKELPNTFLVTLSNGDISQITHDNKLSDIKYLSSGTKYSVNIANIIFSIKHHYNGFYYVDEQFSYVNSDLEITCLNVMVELLGDGEQLFFTTHNPELLALPYPNHSFNFLKKTVDKKGISHIEMINAGTMEKRNNINVKNLYDNDFFGVGPNLEKLYEIGE